ncbi:IPT/TIG domain-containing protein [Chitinophaga pendula]|uniref:IPT/TIG domain-containing protein n=1 Tax=Chitinophaga pendula TaxID=2849666 RepID=UPI001CEC9ADD|nr:IPT/TIG domain-containing protein [Chitinophaga pendula]UCJ05716.1 IPT/TIG domain-containing protein [Chitinophaga pendula]
MRNIIINTALCCLLAFAALWQSCKKESKDVQIPLKVEQYFPNSGKAGTLVTIKGTGLPTDRNNVKVYFGSQQATLVSTQEQKLIVQAPVEGTTGAVTIRVGDQTTEVGNYTYQSLSVRDALPANGPAGASIRIVGEGFSSLKQPAVVTINGKTASIVSASDTAIVAEIPQDAGNGPIVVEVEGKTSTGPNFRYQSITTAQPLTGGTGTRVVIKGQGFESLAAQNKVTFNGLAAIVEEASAEQLIVIAPPQLKTGVLAVTINGQQITGPTFTVVPPPVIVAVTPLSGPAGTRMTIDGLNFSTNITENVVTLNNKPIPVKTASGHALTLEIPAGIGSGELKLAVNGQEVAGPAFKEQTLGISSILPDNGLAGSEITIKGTGFSNVPTENIVTFNGLTATVTSVNTNGTELMVKVPAGVTTGNITVTRGPLKAESPERFRRAGVTTLAGGPGDPLITAATSSIVVDTKGNVYVNGYFHIVKITPQGNTSLFAGNIQQPGATNGTGTAARFKSIKGLTIDENDNLYISDDYTIRKITPAAVVSNYATLSVQMNNICLDKQYNLYGTSGHGGITKLYPSGETEKVVYNLVNDKCRPAVDTKGTLYYSPDMFDSRIVRVPSTIMFTMMGYQDGLLSNAAMMDGTVALQFDTKGRLFIMDPKNYAIRMVDFAAARVSSPMKLANNRGFADGSFTEAMIGSVTDMAIDNQGVIYLLDASNQAVRKVFVQ